MEIKNFVEENIIDGEETERNGLRSYDLDEKHNIKFNLLCQLFEACTKGKTKSKLKYVELDRDRASYGVQETFLGMYYSQILSLPDKEKLMLKHWKNPRYQPEGAPAGDFVGLLTLVLRSRCNDVSKMTINEVNQFLDDLCTSTTREQKLTCLAKFIQRASVTEQKWIAHVILKDLKIGIGHESVFKHLDPRALDVYNSTSSLLEVCSFLKDPKDSKYANTFFQLFYPIKPMLAGRMTLPEIIDNFTATQVFVETKFDGERIQCHINDKNVKFFTRNAVDYTYLYGPKLADAVIKCVNAKSAILDGEIVVWDKANGKYAPFGENKPTANSEEVERQLVYVIFDILYLVTPKGDEYSLTNVILSDRKEILKKIINVVPKKLEIIETKQTANVDEVMEIFNQSVNCGDEGIIIKKVDSIYKPDERSSEWVKMKSEYLESITDTLDLVIIGGYYGEGKRTNKGLGYDWNDHITTFLLGLVKKVDKDDPRKSTILPFVKVGTGYSYEQLEILRQRLKLNWKKYENKSSPSLFGKWEPGINEKPDLFIDDPSESVILEVKGAEIVPTETFPAKITLRFPRVVNIRYDKTWLDALNHKEALKFDEDLQHNRLCRNKRKVEAYDHEDLLELDKEKKKKKVDKYTKILECFRDTETNNISRISNLFQGFEFLVLNLDDNLSLNVSIKKSLECAIVEHGGDKVQNFLPTTTHVISDKMDVRTQNLLNVKDVNVYNSKWVYDSIKLHKVVVISPMYLTYANKETKRKFVYTIDKFNDSFYEDIPPDMLMELFQNMKSFKTEQDFVFILNELKKEFSPEWLNKINF